MNATRIQCSGVGDGGRCASRFGVPCRHMMLVYRKVAQATFSLALMHSNYFKLPQPASVQHPVILSPNSMAPQPPMMVTVTAAHAEPTSYNSEDAGAAGALSENARADRQSANLFALAKQVATGEYLHRKALVRMFTR